MLLPRTYFVEEYTLREHYRTIHAKPYKIVCRSCRQAVTRMAYRLPFYCERCRPPKLEIKGETQQNNKLPVPVGVQTDQSVHKDGVGAAGWEGIRGVHGR